MSCSCLSFRYWCVCRNVFLQVFLFHVLNYIYFFIAMTCCSCLYFVYWGVFIAMSCMCLSFTYWHVCRHFLHVFVLQVFVFYVRTFLSIYFAGVYLSRTDILVDMPCMCLSFTYWHVCRQSPWYNHTGWLGVIHQLTYLLTCRQFFCRCLSSGTWRRLPSLCKASGPLPGTPSSTGRGPTAGTPTSGSRWACWRKPTRWNRWSTFTSWPQARIAPWPGSLTHAPRTRPVSETSSWRNWENTSAYPSSVPATISLVPKDVTDALRFYLSGFSSSWP